jgi:hypothetical protein
MRQDSRLRIVKDTRVPIVFESKLKGRTTRHGEHEQQLEMPSHGKSHDMMQPTGSIKLVNKKERIKDYRLSISYKNTS